MYNAEKIANRRTHPSIRRMRSTRFSNSLQFEEIGSRDVDVSDMVGYERFRGRGLSRVAAFEPALIIFHYCEPPRPAIVPRPSKDHNAAFVPDLSRSGIVVDASIGPRFASFRFASFPTMDGWISRNKAENDNRSLSFGACV